MKKYKAFTLLIVALFCLFQLQIVALGASMTDEAVLGNNRWSVTNAGDLVPNANTYVIGSATQYPASIWLAGAEYTSFAAGTDGNWTDQGLTVTLDRAPTVFIATISTGALAATQFNAGTGGFVAENGAIFDNAADGTVTLTEAGDALSFIFSASTIQLDSSDGGFQFAMSSAGEGQVDFLTNADTGQYMSITTAANVPTIITTGTCDLAIVPDGGDTRVTGTVIASGLVTATGGVTSSTTVTLQNGATIVNSTDNTVEVSEGSACTLSVKETGDSNGDATLLLRADNSTDNGDDWQIVSDGATNSLLFQSDTSGSMVTKFTIPTSGTITFADDIILENGEIIENDTTDDTVSIQSDDAALIFSLYSPLVTAATGTVALQLIADAGADATDRFQIKNNADGTLTFGNDSSVAGTYITKLTLSSAGLLTLINAETIDNTVNNTVTIGSAASMITKLYSSNATDGTVSLQLVGDVGTDVTDGWQIQNPADGTLTIGCDSGVAGTYVTKFTIADSDGDITTIGDIEIIDDMDLVFGTNADWKAQYDEAVDDQLLFLTAGTACAATTDPMVEFVVGATPTANQQVFGVAKGTQASNTALFTVDEDGDAEIAASLQFQTSIFATGHYTGTSALASATSGIGSGSSLAFGIFTKNTGSTFPSGCLANGTVGQMVTIAIGTKVGTWTITPTTKTGFTSIAFDTALDSITLLWLDATRGWIIIGNNGTTIS